MKSAIIGVAGTVVLLGAAGWIFLVSKPGSQDLCDGALAQAARLLTAGEVAIAHSQAALATTYCRGQAQSRATAMQKEVEAALVKKGACEKGFRRAAGQIAEHRLQTAQFTLDKLDPACTLSQQGNGLRQQIVAGKASGDAAAVDVRLNLAQGDVSAARAALVRVIASNREHPDLAALQREIQSANKETRAAEATGLGGQPQRPEPVITRAELPRAPAREPVRTTAAPPVVLPTNNPVNPQSELLRSFLRDAELSMNQLKFDAAKAYIESARRIDPGNPVAASLARQIKERELRYMNEETSIK